MATTVAELQAIITCDTSGFDSGVSEASDKLSELGQTSGNVADQLTTTGKVMTGLGAAILAPLVGAVKGAADFEFAMDAVNASLGGMDTATMDLLEQQAIDLGASTKFSATEIAGVQEQLAKTGLTAQDLLDGATKSVTDLAAATGESLPASADAAATAMHLFGLQGEDMSRIADVLTGTLNQSSATLPDLQRGLNALGPVLANQNRYLEMTEQGLNGAEEAFIDTAGAVGYFNQQGLKAADAGISLARGITNLSNPTSKASNLLAELGISAFDLNGNFIPLPDLFDQLNDKMSGMSDQAREAALATIFGAEAADVMNQAIKKGGQPLRDFTAKLHEEGIAAEQAAIRQDNLQSAVEQLGGALNGLAIQMGTPLLDPIKNATKGITDMVNVLADAPPEVQNFVAQLGLLGGGLLTVGGLAALGTGQVLKLAEQFAAAGLSLPKFAAGLGLIGLAIGAGLLAYDTNFLGFADLVNGAMEKAGKAIDTFGTAFDSSFNARKAQDVNDLSAAVGAFGDALLTATGIDVTKQLDDLANSIDLFGDAFDSSFNARKTQGINDMAAAVGAFGDALLTATGIDITPWTQRMESAINSFAKTWERNMAKGIALIPAFLDSLAAMARAADLPDVANKLQELANGAKRVGDAFRDASQAAKDAGFNDIAAGIMGIGAAIDSALGTDVSPFFVRLGEAAQAFGAEWERARAAGLDPFTSALLATRDALGSLTGVDLGPMFDNFGGAIQSGLQGIGSFKDALLAGDWSTAWDGLTGGLADFGIKMDDIDLEGKLQGVSDQLGNWFQDMSDMLLGTDEQFAPGATQTTGLIQKLADSISGGLQELPDQITQKLGEAGDFFQPVGDWLGSGVDRLKQDLLADEQTFGLGETIKKGVIPQFADDLVSGFRALPQTIGDAIAAFDNPLQGVQDWLGTSVGLLKQDLLGQEQTFGLGETVKQGLVPQLADDLVTGFKSLPQTIGDAIGAIDNPFQSVQDWLGDSIGMLKQKLLAPEQTFGLGETVAQGVIPRFADDLVAGFKALPQTIGDAISEFDNPLQSVQDWLGDGVEQLKQGLLRDQQTFGLGETVSQGVIPQLVDDIGNALQELPGQVTQKLGDVQDAFQPIGDWLQDGITNLGDTLFREQQTFGLGETLSQGVVPQLADDLGNALQALPGQVIQKVGDVQDFFAPIGDWLGTQWEGLTESLLHPTGAGPEGIPTEMPSMIENLANGIGESFAKLPELLTQKLDAIKDPLAGVVDWVEQNITAEGAGLDQLKTAAMDAGTDVAQTISDNLVLGLKTGGADSMGGPGERGEARTDVETAVKDVVGGLANQAIDTLQDATIVPPEFYQSAGDFGQDLGADLGTAVVDGLLRTNPPPEKDLSLAAAQAAGAQQQLSFGDAFKNFDTQFTGALQTSLAPEFQQSRDKLMPWFEQQWGDFWKDINEANLLAGGGGGATKGGISPNLPGGDLPGKMVGDMLEGLGFRRDTGILPQLWERMMTGATGGEAAEKQKGADKLSGALGKSVGESFADALTSEKFTSSVNKALLDVPKDIMAGLGGGMLGMLDKGMALAMKDPEMTGERHGTEFGLAMGDKMVGTLLSGLTDSLTSDVSKAAFAPVAGGLLTSINDAMGVAMKEEGPGAVSDVPGAAGTAPMGQGMGTKLAQTLATGLAQGITDADPAIFIPATTALGTQLGAAMQTTTKDMDVVGGPAGGVGAPVTNTFGTQMVQGLADGLTAGITAAKPEIFQPAVTALGTQLGAAMMLAPAAVAPKGVSEGPAAEQAVGFGQTMTQGLADSLTAGITAAKPEIFTPAVTALGTQLSAAMLATQQATDVVGGPAGGVGAPQIAGFGQTMVQGLATGLAAGITAADPGIFVPVTNALGTQLGAAMQQSAGQAVDVVGGPSGGVGTPQIAGLGTGMVEGLATGLTSQITAAEPAVFAPVAGALQAQLGTALQTASKTTETTGPGGLGGGPISAAPGTGQELVQGLATSMADQITQASPETFAPVGEALGSKTSEALQQAMAAGTEQAGLGGGGGVSDIGAQMGQAVSDSMVSGIGQADFAPVGQAVGTKLNEAVGQAFQGGAIEGGPSAVGNIGEQMGAQITSALEQAVSGADFSGVGENIGAKLKEAITQAIQEAADGISEAMSSITEAMNQAIEDISSTIETAVSDVEAAVNDLAAAVTGATQNVQSAVATMQNAVETAAGTMETAAQGAIDKMSEMGSAAETAASAVASAMASIASSMAAAAGAAVAAAATIIGALNAIAGAAGVAAGAVGSVGTPPAAPGGGGGGFVAESLDVGAETTNGFVEGMSGGAPDIQAAAADLATLAIETLSDEVGAGSPAKKFMPIGASVSQGFMKGMLDDAKQRLASAIGKMAGAVSSAMGKISGAMQKGMDRAHSMVQTAMGRTQKEAAAGGDAAGAAAAGGMAEGTRRETRQAEQAAEQLWKKALKKLLKGKGEARFIGEEFAREFWEGLMSDAGKLKLTGAVDSLEGLEKAAKEFAQAMTFAQYVTEQAMNSAENAVEKVRAKIQGLKTQLDLVNAWIATLQGELDGINAELDSIARSDADAALAAAGQARIDAAQEALDLQKKITAELEKQFQIQFAEAHAAHIAAVQAGANQAAGLPGGNAAAAQADYEMKLAKANATQVAIQESKAKEQMLAEALAAVVKEVAAEAAARAAAAEAERRAELAARKAALEEELAEAKRIAAAIAQAKHDAEVEYTNTVIEESTKRLAQLEKELKKDRGDPEALANDKAQIALEKQRVDLANQLAEALAKQAAGGTPEEMAAVNAQIDYLNAALLALDDVDVGAMLQEIVTKLGEVATTMDSAATSMASAATDLGSMDVAAPVADTAKAVESVGTAASGATAPVRDMASAYNEVMAKMNADSQAFQDKFHAMVAANQTDAEVGGAAIGEALSTQITGKISGGAAALQKTMMDGLTGAIDPATTAAEKGGEAIAKTFGEQMQEKMGTELSDVHKQLLESPPNGITPLMGDATKAAEKGGTDIGHGLGTEMKQGLADKADPFKDKVFHTYDDPIQKGIDDAGKGGNNIGDSLGRGMNDGLSNWAHTIANNVRNIVHNALDAGHDAAGSSKRSRRMMELGDSMGLGLIYGLNQRRGEAEDASASLVHIPRLNPTSDGGVAGGRAGNQTNTTTIHIEHIELPGVGDPQQFMDAMEDFARMHGVSSGRR